MSQIEAQTTDTPTWYVFQAKWLSETFDWEYGQALSFVKSVKDRAATDACAEMGHDRLQGELAEARARLVRLLGKKVIPDFFKDSLDSLCGFADHERFETHDYCLRHQRHMPLGALCPETEDTLQRLLEVAEPAPTICPNPDCGQSQHHPGVCD